MKTGYTHCTLIADRSASMADKAVEATNGIKVLQDEQFALPGEFTFTLAEFDTQYDRVCEMVREPYDYTLVPRGSTALLDSVAHEIVRTGENLFNLAEEDRPEKVLFVIVTDGEENSSTKYDLEEVKSMIDHQKENYGWEFLFLGADTAAWMGKALGTHTSSYQNTGAGTTQAYATASSTLRSMRSGDAIDVPENI